jgi:methylmalonyl-CoA/ethylmalonyl-CoA epimerase
MTSAHPADLSGSSIGQIAINVHELERAVAFYRDKLGLRFLFQPGPALAFFDCGGVRLYLGKPETPEHDHLASVLYFKVPDIRAVHATLAGRGVAFEGEPHLIGKLPDHELWMAFFRDSEDNVMALMSEVR